jgi:hypothetical protein
MPYRSAAPIWLCLRADGDESVAVVPSCCEWDGNSITTIPATSVNASALSDIGTHGNANGALAIINGDVWCCAGTLLLPGALQH